MKILMVAGSSGGHIFPALALLQRIKDSRGPDQVLLVLPRSAVSRGIEVPGARLAYIDSSNLSPKIDSRNLIALSKSLKGAWQSLIIFLRFRPDVVVGFGSIASVPLVLLGWFMRVKVVLHEQNVIPGKATRFLLRFCDRIAISFGSTGAYLKCCPDKAVITGNPLRKELVRIDKAKCREFFCLGGEAEKTVLVMGGSQGSSRVNRAFLEAVSEMSCRGRLQVIHLSGAQDQAMLQDGYSRAGVKASVFAFLNEMEYALSLADLAVCRAGATSIHELIHYRLPAVLLPYPFAYQHQSANAGVLGAKEAAVIVEDKGPLKDRLKAVLERLLADGSQLEKMRSAFDSFKEIDSAEALRGLVMDASIGHA